MPETYREFIKRRFREEGKPATLAESARMLSAFAAEWRGERKENASMANKGSPTSTGKPPLHVLRARTVEAAANAGSHTPVSTPVTQMTPGGKVLVMRIHKIAAEVGFPDTVAATRTAVSWTLATRTVVAPALLQLNEDGVIARGIVVADNATSAGGVLENDHLPNTWDFGEQGLLVADKTLDLGVLGTANVNPKDVRIAIYYTLETLEPSEYLASVSIFGA